MSNEFPNQSHKRLNILTGEWVLVSPHRNERPWLGQKDEAHDPSDSTYDPDCYLCPGNTRAGGQQNPDYSQTFTFRNDFAALQENVEPGKIEDGLLISEREKGICKVICFSPDHSKSLSQMKENEIEQVISVWQEEYEQLGQLTDINYVQIFENKGSIMGCSNPHPHGQIWAQHSIPDEVIKKDNSQSVYFRKNQKSLLGDYLEQESKTRERMIYENDHFVLVVPFWAIWPFETMIIPKSHRQDVAQITESERQSFAKTIQLLTRVYDKLFDCPFPYSSGIHQAPTNEKQNDHWHWHMSFYPPLLRSSSVKKFMVGYEMFAMPQRDITPEIASQRMAQIPS